MNTEQSDLLQAEFAIDDYASNNLLTITKWTKFLGISFAIFTGLGLIVFLVGGTVFFDTLNDRLNWGIEKESIGNFTLLFAVAVVIVALIAGFFCYLAIAFSVFIKKGLVTTDQDALEKGFALLKNYFIVIGVFSIIGLLANLFTTFLLKL
jgi:hypothetical protein